MYQTIHATRPSALLAMALLFAAGQPALCEWKCTAAQLCNQLEVNKCGGSHKCHCDCGPDTIEGDVYRWANGCTARLGAAESDSCQPPADPEDACHILYRYAQADRAKCCCCDRTVRPILGVRWKRDPDNPGTDPFCTSGIPSVFTIVTCTTCNARE